MGSATPCDHENQQHVIGNIDERAHSETVVEVIVVGLRAILGISGVWRVVVLPVHLHKAARAFTVSPRHRSRGEQMYALGSQGHIFGSGKPMYHLRIAILEDHLEQDRRGVHEYGLDLVGVVPNFSRSLEGSGNVSGGIAVGHGLGTDDVFDRADGLDEVFLDCWM